MTDTTLTCQYCGTRLVVCHEEVLPLMPTKEDPRGRQGVGRRLHCNSCGICYENDGKTFFEGNDPRVIHPGITAPVGHDDSLTRAHESLQTEHAKTLDELKKADADFDALEKENAELKAKLAEASKPAASSSSGTTGSKS